MQIDPRLEGQMRNALSAAVKKDAALFDHETRALNQPTDIATTVQILALIGNNVLRDMYGGALPDDDQTSALAATVAGEEGAWSSLTEPEIRSYLDMIRGGPRPEVEPVVGVVLSFVVTASLLAGSQPKSTPWWEYLDVVEARIENQVS